ncbi:MAG TPA: Hsp20/alpha crystallin family protein [Ideonella sp.]|uniref:Hsp20/alpha crystallin family protein n=1 Tax=Ideonella sp. TaxID=1929293 RepID=UPI002E32FAE4|nr:Hsp20/alpha crystallin family protein [Ideonella sp.]HEX5684331.1 Hsp20/alpha crystallin family protein [Ideonella sp.]
MTTSKTELQKTSQTPPATTEQAERGADTRALLPRVDVFEDDAGITLLADLPGVPRDQLDIKIDGDTLTIEGAVATTTPAGLQPAYVELRVPRYRRAFTLSRELDAGHIEANLKDGVLNLRIPKQAHAQPRRVNVQVG